jgi:hypothetical protein
MQLTQEELNKIVKSIAMTRQEEFACDECFNELDRFVELIIQGKEPSEAMPMIQDHLDRCGNCREEFEALLKALEIKL